MSEERYHIMDGVYETGVRNAGLVLLTAAAAGGNLTRHALVVMPRLISFTLATFVFFLCIGANTLLWEKSSPFLCGCCYTATGVFCCFLFSIDPSSNRF